MNLYEMRREFDRSCRSTGLTEMEDLRDEWLNLGWARITEVFVIPSMSKTVVFDAVANQQEYPLPYDYNGTEVALKYNRRRLDPLSDETLQLKYERRQNNLGAVRFYTWQGTAGEDLLEVADCTLTNGSAVVQTSSTSALLDLPHWVRFDPYQDETNADADNEGYVNPGDYGYQIDSGQQISGTSFQLLRPYRGPTGAQFNCRVRPAEMQQIAAYGIPISSESDVFELTYTSKPRRLWNNSDVPEWPNMGRPITYMALSLALEWHHAMDLSKTFWSRAMTQVKGLEQRRKKTSTLISDISIGSAVGRQVGMRGVWLGDRGGGRRM